MLPKTPVQSMFYLLLFVVLTSTFKALFMPHSRPELGLPALLQSNRADVCIEESTEEVPSSECLVCGKAI